MVNLKDCPSGVPKRGHQRGSQRGSQGGSPGGAREGYFEGCPKGLIWEALRLFASLIYIKRKSQLQDAKIRLKIGDPYRTLGELEYSKKATTITVDL